MKHYFLSILASFIYLFSSAQNPSSGEIKQDIKKLGKLGTVLYFAAHPDDENQRLIAYYAKRELYESAYFSLTRGDGGQNLIGDEKGDLLGVIRTQELLQARNIDGGQQFFSRAVDFGYSKTVKETLEMWNEDSILYDAVWVLRQFQPDVIITRFPPDGRAGHGHHTASAVVAIEAMKLAADPTVFPDQLEQFSTWQVKRLFINTGPWWQPNIDSLALANPGKFAKVNVGEYDPVLGKSYSEIAGASRSKHKSQGFGASLSKGDRWEYLELVEGDAFDNDIMDGLNTDWNRIGNHKKLQESIENCVEGFNEAKPWESIDQLLEIRDLISQTENDHWKKVKTEEVENIIQSCLGLVVEALSETETWIENKANTVSLNILNRSPYPIKLLSINTQGFDTTMNNLDLASNEWLEITRSFLFKDLNSTQPYWLKNEHAAFFNVGDKSLTGVAELANSPAFVFEFQLKEGENISISKNVNYKQVDRVKGELIHEVFVSPEFSLHPISKMVLFRSGEKKNVDFLITSADTLGVFSFYPDLKEGWKGPKKVDVSFTTVGKPERVSLEIEAPKEASELIMQPYLEVNSARFNTEQLILDYDHIESKMLNVKVSVKLLTIDVINNGEHIAYIEGAGDEIPAMLKEMGYYVNIIEVSDLANDLSQYDALIFGVRAYNVFPELANYHENIMKFTEEGGHVVMQYNTSRGMDIPLGPYPFELSRSRVTDENAEVDIVLADDPVLNYPNKIGKSDFDNWVQERGLYFADNWSDKYRAPLSWADPGEDPLQGSLLVSDYGEGVFVYTSISFFRQLPAGVPGAYRLFSNIIAGGKKANKLEAQKDKK